MILFHLSESSLKAMLKSYNILLISGCKSQENIIRFRDECLKELQRRYGLYKIE